MEGHPVVSSLAAGLEDDVWAPHEEAHDTPTASGSSDNPAAPTITSDFFTTQTYEQQQQPNYQHQAGHQQTKVLLSLLLQNVTMKLLNLKVQDMHPLLSERVFPVIDFVEATVVEYWNLGHELALAMRMRMAELFEIAQSTATRILEHLGFELARMWVAASIRYKKLELRLDSEWLTEVWRWTEALALRALESATRLKADLPSRLQTLLPIITKAQVKQLEELWAFLLALISQHYRSIITATAVMLLVLVILPRLKTLLSNMDARVLILGLDNSGKTTLLLMLKDNKVTIPNRTKEPNVVELRLGSTRLHATDLGGHETARSSHPWAGYMGKHITGVVFVVDASDTARLDKARKELESVLRSDALGPSVPVVVLGNKIDLGAAMSEAELVAGLGLGTAATTPRVKVFMCSLVHKMGYGSGLKWLLGQHG